MMQSQSIFYWKLLIVFVATIIGSSLILVLFSNKYSKLTKTFDEETEIFTFESHQIKNEDWPSIKLSIKRKMHNAIKIIKTGKADVQSMDPINLSDLWFIFNDKKGFLNVTLHDVKIHGLSFLVLKDIATNSLTKSLSVLMRCPDLLINGNYQIQHQTKEYFNEDSKMFYINIKNWYISWFANVIGFQNITDSVDVKNLKVKSYFDNRIEDFNFMLKDYSKHHQFNINVIVSMILDKAKNKVNEKFTRLLSFFVKEHNSNDSVLNTFEKFSSFHKVRQKRQVPCEKGKELDEYVDSLFRFGSRIIRAMEPMSLPNTTIDLPDYNLKFFLHNGQLTRAYTLSRKRSAWVYCGSDSVSLGLTVGFDKLFVKYKYRAITNRNLLFDGELEADIKGTISQIQFTQTTPEDEDEDVQQRVDRLKVWKLGKIRVLLKGLGNLTQALSMILTSALNNNQEQLKPTIKRFETEGVKMINNQIKNISIPFFSII